MANLTELPFELLTNITAHLDRQSLKQLRSTCRQFHESTTPRIFQTLHLFPNDKSNRKFNRILKDERVRDFVQEIYLNTCEKDSVSEATLLVLQIPSLTIPAGLLQTYK